MTHADTLKGKSLEIHRRHLLAGGLAAGALAASGGLRGALGAYQDLVAMSEGFGAVFTVGPPLATDGGTDVLFARLLAE